MKKTGASLAVYALEQLPIRYTFGIPGVHNTELYDELGRSRKIRPLLVTHECGGAFMADAISRTSDDIGTLAIVPGAGMTNALSGIGEAFLDGIPMLIISGGIRRDTGRSFQIHDVDQHRILSGITKRTFLIKDHEEIVPTIFEAYHVAISGEPGPVFVEISANIQLFEGEAGDYESCKLLPIDSAPVDNSLIAMASDLLARSTHPGIFAGWGARYATDQLIEIAELLEAPVSTTLQGLSVFPGSHPLFAGMGFGPAAVPAAENAFKKCDCLLAVGTRFGEIPTGSFGVHVPTNLVHIDINPAVFDKNYPAMVAIEGDAREGLARILEALKEINPAPRRESIRKQIAADRESYLNEWRKLKTDRVNPAMFFDVLRARLSEDAIVAVDDGNHTYLAAELFTSLMSRRFISPTDFNCMGYCIPAAIGAKLANPDKQVIGIVGDGSFMMTCMEIMTAAREKVGVVYFLFSDGELSQISQGQERTYRRKTCTVFGELKLEGLAFTLGAGYKEINKDEEAGSVIENSLELAASGIPVIVNVRIEYEKATRFTSGVVKNVFKKFPTKDKVRFATRSAKRKITG